MKLIKDLYEIEFNKNTIEFKSRWCCGKSSDAISIINDAVKKASAKVLYINETAFVRRGMVSHVIIFDLNCPESSLENFDIFHTIIEEKTKESDRDIIINQCSKKISELSELYNSNC